MGNRYLDNTDIVYYINRDVTIPIGSTLTIAPGVMLKFTLDSSLFIMENCKPMVPVPAIQFHLGRHHSPAETQTITEPLPARFKTGAGSTVYR